MPPPSCRIMISAAIWGYGPHGKNIRRLVERFSPDRYRITAVMDRNAAAAEADDVPGGQIFDPARVRELYRTGLFEGVIIGTWNENASAQIRAELDAAGVPVLPARPEALSASTRARTAITTVFFMASSKRIVGC